MHANSTQYTAVHDGSSRTSEDSLTLTEVEKQGLFDSRPDSGLTPRQDFKKRSRERISWIVSGILVLLNAALFVAFIRQRHETKVEPAKSWLPPEIHHTSLFEFQTIFGEPLNNKSEAAWNALMPVGRGFVIIKNDTALPDQPGLYQSVPQQKAMIAVFHQLHCLYMTREGYFSAMDGNVNQVNHAHLTHCFDYLRQTIMCFADTTLEWLPPPPKDTGSTGWGFEHKCRDFNAVAQWAEDNRLKTTFGIH